MASGECYVVSGSSLESVVESDRVQLMPCEIACDGEAKIASYFDTTVRKETDEDQKTGFLDASFRGHKLKGTVMDMPPGYVGYVLREDREPTTDDEDHTLRASHRFNKFTYWNRETPPSGDDAILKAMQWIRLASVLHGQHEEDTFATPETIR